MKVILLFTFLFSIAFSDVGELPCFDESQLEMFSDEATGNTTSKFPTSCDEAFSNSYTSTENLDKACECNATFSKTSRGNFNDNKAVKDQNEELPKRSIKSYQKALVSNVLAITQDYAYLNANFSLNANSDAAVLVNSCAFENLEKVLDGCDKDAKKILDEEFSSYGKGGFKDFLATMKNEYKIQSDINTPSSAYDGSGLLNGFTKRTKKKYATCSVPESEVVSLNEKMSLSLLPNFLEKLNVTKKELGITNHSDEKPVFEQLRLLKESNPSVAKPILDMIRDNRTIALIMSSPNGVDNLLKKTAGKTDPKEIMDVIQSDKDFKSNLVSSLRERCQNVYQEFDKSVCKGKGKFPGDPEVVNDVLKDIDTDETLSIEDKYAAQSAVCENRNNSNNMDLLRSYLPQNVPANKPIEKITSSIYKKVKKNRESLCKAYDRPSPEDFIAKNSCPELNAAEISDECKRARYLVQIREERKLLADNLLATYGTEEEKEKYKKGELSVDEVIAKYDYLGQSLWANKSERDEIFKAMSSVNGEIAGNGGGFDSAGQPANGAVVGANGIPTLPSDVNGNSSNVQGGNLNSQNGSGYGFQSGVTPFTPRSSFYPNESSFSAPAGDVSVSSSAFDWNEFSRRLDNASINKKPDKMSETEKRALDLVEESLDLAEKQNDRINELEDRFAKANGGENRTPSSIPGGDKIPREQSVWGDMADYNSFVHGGNSSVPRGAPAAGGTTGASLNTSGSINSVGANQSRFVKGTHEEVVENEKKIFPMLELVVNSEVDLKDLEPVEKEELKQAILEVKENKQPFVLAKTIGKETVKFMIAPTENGGFKVQPMEEGYSTEMISSVHNQILAFYGDHQQYFLNDYESTLDGELKASN